MLILILVNLRLGHLWYFVVAKTETASHPLLLGGAGSGFNIFSNDARSVIGSISNRCDFCLSTMRKPLRRFTWISTK